MPYRKYEIQRKFRGNWYWVAGSRGHFNDLDKAKNAAQRFAPAKVYLRGKCFRRSLVYKTPGA